MFKKQIWFIIRLIVIVETFKKYYPSLAGNLALKLSKPPNSFGIQSANSYYKKCNLKERLLFAKIKSVFFSGIC